jgi:hypothetical protein
MLAISVFRAISDAIASLAGHRVLPALDAPATPERVLSAVERLRAAASQPVKRVAAARRPARAHGGGRVRARHR